MGTTGGAARREAERGRFPPGAADAVTLARIALMPVFLLAAEATNAAVAAGLPAGRHRALVLALLLAIGASDKLDGWLARRSGQPPTQRGAILDATSDRIVQWAGVLFFTLRASPAFTPLPVWLAAVLVARDTLLLAIWIRQRRTGTVSFEHEIHGKAATVAVFVALFAATASANRAVATAAAALAGAAVVYSTVHYAARIARRGADAI
jgi:CDP-diacylglycerol--glycerol-3-phosphate 3-phosphatidyltransferase/cardiolipin synthase